MTTYYEIPLSGSPQTFKSTIGGITYALTFLYRNVPGGGWTLDVQDVNGNNLVGGVPLVTGADLLAQYPDLGFPFKLAVVSDGDPDAVPTFTGLGSTSHLYVVSEP